MDPIIRAAAIAPVSRQLRRPGVAPIGQDGGHPPRQGGQHGGGNPAQPGLAAPTDTLGAAGSSQAGNTGSQATSSGKSGSAVQSAPGTNQSSKTGATVPAQRPPSLFGFGQAASAPPASAETGSDAAPSGGTAAGGSAQQQSEADLQEAKIAAERKGHAEGLVKGEQAAHAKLAEYVARLRSVIAQLQEARTQVIASSEDMMVKIVFEAVCRIIGHSSGQRASVLAMVQQVMQELRQQEALVLSLHPQDLALVQDGLAEIGINPEQTQLRADPSLKMGGCLVESNVGTLDASLETQLSRLRDTLLQVRRGEEYPGEAP